MSSFKQLLFSSLHRVVQKQKFWLFNSSTRVIMKKVALSIWWSFSDSADFFTVKLSNNELNCGLYSHQSAVPLGKTVWGLCKMTKQISQCRPVYSKICLSKPLIWGPFEAKQQSRTISASLKHHLVHGVIVGSHWYIKTWKKIMNKV